MLFTLYAPDFGLGLFLFEGYINLVRIKIIFEIIGGRRMDDQRKKKLIFYLIIWGKSHLVLAPYYLSLFLFLQAELWREQILILYIG